MNFVPQPYRKQQVTFRIETVKLERLERLLTPFGLNRSEFINRCIDYALEHMVFDSSEGKRP